MSENGRHGFDRRAILKTSAMALGGALLAGEPIEAYPKGVNPNSSPSALKITDLRVATIVKPGPVLAPSFGSILIRAYTDSERLGMAPAQPSLFS